MWESRGVVINKYINRVGHFVRSLNWKHPSKTKSWLRHCLWVMAWIGRERTLALEFMFTRYTARPELYFTRCLTCKCVRIICSQVTNVTQQEKELTFTHKGSYTHMFAQEHTHTHFHIYYNSFTQFYLARYVTSTEAEHTSIWQFGCVPLYILTATWPWINGARVAMWNGKHSSQ